MGDVEAPPLAYTALILAGALGVVIGLCWLAARERNAASSEADSPQQWRLPTLSRRAWLLLTVILIGAFALRLEGLDQRSLGHVEIYAPGIELPEGISEPPPRTELGPLLWWHFHDEPHPQAYYFGMFLWAKAFGTSEIALRLPSTLSAMGCMLFMFLLVRRHCGEAVALLTLAFIAINGHQIYWAQQARMYAFVGFLAAMSVWALAHLVESGRRRLALEAFYVCVTWLGLASQAFFWPFVAAQMLWTLLLRSGDGHSPVRALHLQTLVCILGSPFITHALYRSRDLQLRGPDLAFIREFFTFGFLFEKDGYSLPAREEPYLPYLLASLLAAVLLAAAFRRVRQRTREAEPNPCEETLASAPLGVVAVGVAVFILGIAGAAHRRHTLLFGTSLLPIAGLLVMPALQRVRGLSDRIVRHTGPIAEQMGKTALYAVLPTVTFALLFAMAVEKPLLKSRGLVEAVPFLLAWLALGVWRLPGRALRIGVLCVLLPLHLISVEFYRNIGVPNDHRSIARQMLPRLQADDLIFAQHRDWVSTPIYYYLQGEHHRLVTQDYARAARRNPAPRIWVLQYSERPLPYDMKQALEGFRVIDRIEATRSVAWLYAPK